MYILAIETTGVSASVALINEDGVVLSEFSNDKLNHLQNLINMTNILLKKNDITIENVDYIAVSEGPGSFTGIRIGVSTSRAIAQAMGIKIIPVPTLKSFLYNLPESNAIYCPIFDAKRKQVYGGAYKWAEDKKNILEIAEGDAYIIENLLKKVEEVGENQEVIFFGDGILPYENEIENWKKQARLKGIKVTISSINCRFQNAESIARLGLKLYYEGAAKEYSFVKPVYMRKSEAERRLEEGILNG